MTSNTKSPADIMLILTIPWISIVFSFSPDPTARTTFWTQSLGGTTVHLCMYAASQTQIQKFLSIAKVKDAQK